MQATFQPAVYVATQIELASIPLYCRTTPAFTRPIPAFRWTSQHFWQVHIHILEYLNSNKLHTEVTRKKIKATNGYEAQTQQRISVEIQLL